MRLPFLVSAGWFSDVEAVLRTVHVLPKHPLVYRRSFARVRYEGRYVASENDGADILYVSVHSLTPHLTFAHETGHRVEIRGLAGAPVTRQEKFPSWSDPMLRDWRQAVLGSGAVARMQSLFGNVSEETDALIAYYLEPEELWARSYAQYVAVRSSHAVMQTELDDIQSLARTYRILPRQWQDTDFMPIMEAIETLFEAKGWSP